MKPGTGEYVEVDGIRTYFVRQGSGPAVVLLHGQPPGASVHVIWDRNIGPLAEAGFTVYAFDQEGFGRTDHSSEYSRERRVRDPRAVVRAMGLGAAAQGGLARGS